MMMTMMMMTTMMMMMIMMDDDDGDDYDDEDAAPIVTLAMIDSLPVRAHATHPCHSSWSLMTTSFLRFFQHYSNW